MFAHCDCESVSVHCDCESVSVHCESESVSAHCNCESAVVYTVRMRVCLNTVSVCLHSETSESVSHWILVRVSV